MLLKWPGTAFLSLSSAVWILSSSGLRAEGQEPPRRPNVLFVVMDAVRPDHLSCYGYSRKTTPHLDRVAREATLYESCISAASWTLPSMSSIFTGLYPRDHGVNSQELRLDPSHLTMAELFRKAGYATVGYSCNAWVGSSSGLDRGFDEFYDIWRGLTDSRVDDGAEIINEWIGDWLDVSYDSGRPFFMFALYFEPHFPYRPPPPYDARFLTEDMDRRLLARLQRWKHPREVGYVLGVPGMEVSSEEFEILKSQYDGELGYVDFRFGELLRILEERNLLDETIVVVTSDHGEHLGEHRLMDHKMSLYEEVIRIPLIIRYPGRVPAGLRIRGQVQSVNILPALLSLSGIESDGASLHSPLPVVVGSSGQPYTFSEFARPQLFLDVMSKAFPGADSRPFDRALKTVRTERYKLIWSSDGQHELYDLSLDPAEAVNLYGREDAPLQQLMKVLDDFNAGKLPENAANQR